MEKVDKQNIVFTPKTIKEGSTEIYDYTGVPQNSIRLYSDNDKDIIRPSWIPEINIDFLLLHNFLPPAVKGKDDMWYVETEIARIRENANNIIPPPWKDNNGNIQQLTPKDWKDRHEIAYKYYKQHIFTRNEYVQWDEWKKENIELIPCICKMESGTLAATTSWYINEARNRWLDSLSPATKEEIKWLTSTASLPRGHRSMTPIRYKEMQKLAKSIPIIKNDFESTVAGAKNRKTGISYWVFNQYEDLLETIKTKINDIDCQRTENENAYNKGEETSYGDTNLSDVLLADYGVKIKKQNGTDITPTETDAIRQILDAAWKGYHGDLSQTAREYGLKISYADNVNMHARKAIGLFYDVYHAIGVSFKDEKQSLNITQSMMTIAHETAHWLDCLKGKDNHYYYISDMDGSKENTIAKEFRKRFIGQDKLKGYWTRTCECFARAVEEDFALTLAEQTNNPNIAQEIYSQRGYCPKIWFDDIRPLVQEVIAENKKRFASIQKTVQVERKSNLTQEEREYVHSEEFKARFGDWEKAQRIEKLKKSESIIGKDRIILDGKDITDEVNALRNRYSKENLVQLQKITDELGKSKIKEYKEKQYLKQMQSPIFTNTDTNRVFSFHTSAMREISSHNLFQFGHIEAMQSIPEIINKSIYLCSEDNEDNRKPNLKKFHYFALGLKISGLDFTSKSVFVEMLNGDIYYDQSLSTIEKGKLVDIMLQKEKPEAFNPIISQDSSELFEENKSPNVYYDKRLFRICQVPQMKYLDENLEPTKEAIALVKAGQLYVEKHGQVWEIVDKTHTEKIKVQSALDYNQTKLKETIMKKAQEPSQITANAVSNVIPTQHGKEVVEQWLQQDRKIAEMQPKKTIFQLNVKIGNPDKSYFNKTYIDRLFDPAFESDYVKGTIIDEETLRLVDKLDLPKNLKTLLHALPPQQSFPNVYIKDKPNTPSLPEDSVEQMKALFSHIYDHAFCVDYEDKYTSKAMYTSVSSITPDFSEGYLQLSGKGKYGNSEFFRQRFHVDGDKVELSKEIIPNNGYKYADEWYQNLPHIQELEDIREKVSELKIRYDRDREARVDKELRKQGLQLGWGFAIDKDYELISSSIDHFGSIKRQDYRPEMDDRMYIYENESMPKFINAIHKAQEQTKTINKIKDEHLTNVENVQENNNIQDFILEVEDTNIGKPLPVKENIKSNERSNYTSWQEVLENEFAPNRILMYEGAEIRKIYNGSYNVITSTKDTFAERLKKVAGISSIRDEGCDVDYSSKGIDITVSFKDGKIERRLITWNEAAKFAERLINMEKAHTWQPKNKELTEEERMQKRTKQIDHWTKWLVEQHGCNEKDVRPTVNKIFDVFYEEDKFTPDIDRVKILPIAFGNAHNQYAPWVVEKDLEEVFGLYDKNINYQTVWDREFAAIQGWKKEDVARLMKYDYADNKFLRESEQENLFAEKKEYHHVFTDKQLSIGAEEKAINITVDTPQQTIKAVQEGLSYNKEKSVFVDKDNIFDKINEELREKNREKQKVYENAITNFVEEDQRELFDEAKTKYPNGFYNKDTNISIAFNEAQHGIEVRSRDKLSDTQEKELIEKGFKWSNNKQLWYAKQDNKDAIAWTATQYLSDHTKWRDTTRENIQKCLLNSNPSVTRDEKDGHLVYTQCISTQNNDHLMIQAHYPVGYDPRTILEGNATEEYEKLHEQQIITLKGYYNDTEKPLLQLSARSNNEKVLWQEHVSNAFIKMMDKAKCPYIGTEIKAESLNTLENSLSSASLNKNNEQTKDTLIEKASSNPPPLTQSPNKNNADALKAKERKTTKNINHDIQPILFGAEDGQVVITVFENKTKGLINIKISTSISKEQAELLMAELKENGWKYAPSYDQWYPYTKEAKKHSHAFAKAFSEKANGLENKEIKFFDSYYDEPEALCEYINSHQGSNKVPLTVEEAKIIIAALDQDTNWGWYINEGRKTRIGVDKDGRITILSKTSEGNMMQRVSTDGLFVAAQKAATASVQEMQQLINNKNFSNEIKQMFSGLNQTASELFTEMQKKMNAVCKNHNIIQTVDIKKHESEKPQTIKHQENVFEMNVTELGSGIYGITPMSYIAIEKHHAQMLSPEIRALLSPRNGLLATRNRKAEPYVVKELIDKRMYPQDDKEYCAQVCRYVETHPLKYIDLAENNAVNFRKNVIDMAKIDNTHDLLATGQKLINMATQQNKAAIKEYLKKCGCTNETSMKKLFMSWQQNPNREECKKPIQHKIMAEERIR